LSGSSGPPVPKRTATGNPVDAAALVGERVEVAGARPTAKRDGWLIAVYADPTFVDRTERIPYVYSLDWWFAEESLAPAGLPAEWEREA